MRISWLRYFYYCCNGEESIIVLLHYKYFTALDTKYYGVYVWAVLACSLAGISRLAMI